MLVETSSAGFPSQAQQSVTLDALLQDRVGRRTRPRHLQSTSLRHLPDAWRVRVEFQIFLQIRTLQLYEGTGSSFRDAGPATS